MTCGGQPEYGTNQIRVLLMTGSVRRPSHTRTLTTYVERALASHGVATAHWDLGEHALPIADPIYHDDPASHPDEAVRELIGLAEDADGFVIASPTYHNAYSGVLKNALDHLAIRQFTYKPVALAGHGGGRSSTQAVDQLRAVVRGLHAVAIPAQVCTQRSDFRPRDEDDYEIVSEDVLFRIARLAAELIVFVYQLRATRPRNGNGVHETQPGSVQVA